MIFLTVISCFRFCKALPRLVELGMQFHSSRCDIDAIGEECIALYRLPMTKPTTILPAAAFAKIDTGNDNSFYAAPRFVTHIDHVALNALTAFYAENLSAGGHILDLMSSWISHLPDVFTGSVTGHGMNAEELAANARLNRYFVQNLNQSPHINEPDASFDAALCCAGVQYLAQPYVVFAEIARVLRPSAPFMISFSNRCFPTKAVEIWRKLHDDGHAQLVEHYLEVAGFANIKTHTLCDGLKSDPMIAVIGFAPVQTLI